MIEESTKYESCIDVKAEIKKSASLAKFMGIEEDERKEWEKHWVAMPEFENNENEPYKKIIVNFKTKEDYDEFAKIINQPLTDKTKSIWHPRPDRDQNALRRWIEE